MMHQKHVWTFLLLAALLCVPVGAPLFAQTEDPAVPSAAEPEAGPAPETVEAPPALEAPEAVEAPPAAGSEKDDLSGLSNPENFTEYANSCWTLLKKGGWMMYPIAVMSLLVVAVGLERLLALCGCFVMPGSLLRTVDTLAARGADPREIFKTARSYGCAAGRVVSGLIQKTGRPMLEVQAQYDTLKSNEANRLFGPVRFLTLAASVTPLMGLLGTVIGMIQAFIATAEISAATAVGINRAEVLSQGIYTALVTTCAGLIVAIPAAMLAHWYEGRIIRRFDRLDKRLAGLFSYMESKEGNAHFTPRDYESYGKRAAGKSTSAANSNARGGANVR